MHILAGDIGGTHTRLALLDWDGARFTEQCVVRYASDEADTLLSLVERFVAERGEDFAGIDAAGFGIAGPVRGDEVQATNLPWRIRRDELEEALGAPVALVNDFVAVAHGVPHIERTSVRGEMRDLSAGALFIGAGTGLGVAWQIGEEIGSSEAGHVHFAPRDEEERALLAFAQRRHPRVSAERLISGSGLPLVHAYFAERDPNDTLESGEAVAEAADGGDEAAQRALLRFVSMFGAYCGDIALVNLPCTLVLAGGVAPKLRESLSDFDERFLGAFDDKGRMRALNERVSVQLAADEAVGRLGAAAAAVRLAKSGNT